MDAPRTSRRATRRARVGWLTLALLAACAALPAASAAARGQAAVDTAQASTPAFVPDWDGHTDSAVVRYTLLQRSSVVVRVLDASGRVVATQRAGVLDGGVHHAAWDGRDASGRVLRAGRYRIRIDARPVAVAPQQPASASLGGAPIVAGARAAVVTLQRPNVALTAVQLDRTSLGRSRAAARASARFRLSSTATVSVAIVDAGGKVVRTLASGRRRAGTNLVRWDGRTAGGAVAADGEYALVIAATGGARPTATSRLPLRVDRVAPRLAAPVTATAAVSAGSVRIFVRITASEAGMLELRHAGRTVRLQVPAGTRRVRVTGADLGIAARDRQSSRRIVVRLVDGAGNAAARAVDVSVPARARTRPTAPQPSPPTTPIPTPPAQPTAHGAWAWPVAGIVTSEFGLRNGRPHTGIDIAAPAGAPVHPSAAGTVSFVGVLGGYGNLVIVEHPGGMRTYYAHLSRFGSFAAGAAVAPTDVIGLVGCTGSCTGPHVHFETRRDDVPVDPRVFLAAG